MLPFKPKIFIANTTQDIECSPPRGLPLPVVGWYRGSAQIPSEGRVYQAGNKLIFNETSQKDSGIYTCHAKNKAGEKTSELNITVASKEPLILFNLSCLLKKSFIANELL